MCVSVLMCTCPCVCMDVPVCIHVCVSVHVCTYVPCLRIYVRVPLYVHVRRSMCMHGYVYMHGCACVCMSMRGCMCPHVYARVSMCMRGHVCVYVCPHECAWMCLCLSPHVCTLPWTLFFLEPFGAEYPVLNILAWFPGDRDTFLTNMSLPRLGKGLCHRWSIHISPGIPTTSFPCGPGSRPGAHSIFNCQVSSGSMTQNNFSIFLSAASLRVKAFRIDCCGVTPRVASLLVPGGWAHAQAVAQSGKKGKHRSQVSMRWCGSAQSVSVPRPG